MTLKLDSHPIENSAYRSTSTSQTFEAKIALMLERGFQPATGNSLLNLWNQLAEAAKAEIITLQIREALTAVLGISSRIPQSSEMDKIVNIANEFSFMPPHTAELRREYELYCDNLSSPLAHFLSSFAKGILATAFGGVGIATSISWGIAIATDDMAAANNGFYISLTIISALSFFACMSEPRPKDFRAKYLNAEISESAQNIAYFIKKIAELEKKKEALQNSPGTEDQIQSLDAAAHLYTQATLQYAQENTDGLILMVEGKEFTFTSRELGIEEVTPLALPEADAVTPDDSTIINSLVNLPELRAQLSLVAPNTFEAEFELGAEEEDTQQTHKLETYKALRA